MKTRMRMFASALALTLLAAGCGKKAEAPAEAKAEAKAETPDEAKADEAKADEAKPAEAAPAAAKPEYGKLATALYAPDTATFDKVLDESFAAIQGCEGKADKPHLFADDACGNLAQVAIGALSTPPTTLSDGPSKQGPEAQAAWDLKYGAKLIGLITWRTEAVKLAALYGCRPSFAAVPGLAEAAAAVAGSTTNETVKVAAEGCVAKLKPADAPAP